MSSNGVDGSGALKKFSSTVGYGNKWQILLQLSWNRSSCAVHPRFFLIGQEKIGLLGLILYTLIDLGELNVERHCHTSHLWNTVSMQCIEGSC
jgi:hypothetical protein